MIVLMIGFPYHSFLLLSSATDFSLAAAAFSHLAEMDVGRDLIRPCQGLFSTPGRLALYRRIENRDMFA